ncbi:MAG: GNAT family N-acetyltransferase [Chloroflexi bacterium]|nr:GNAT family N-acetyltransferase [Chloroflexota bacterium]
MATVAILSPRRADAPMQSGSDAVPSAGPGPAAARSAAPALTLTPMSPADLECFIREEIADCLREHIEDERWPASVPLDRAEEELSTIARLEREAVRSQDHRLWAAQTPDGTVVGWLWVKLPVTGACAGRAFLCQMTVAACMRRRGFGRAMLAALEQRLLAEGVSELWLNVWEENAAAKSLYENTGFEVLERHATIRQMRKRLLTG